MEPSKIAKKKDFMFKREYIQYLKYVDKLIRTTAPYWKLKSDEEIYVKKQAYRKNYNYKYLGIHSKKKI